MRPLLLGAAAALLVGCAGPKLPPPIEKGTPLDAPRPEFPAQVRFERPGLTCRGVTKAARAALKRLGYSIVSVVPPSPGVLGEIRALRHGDWSNGDPDDAYHVAARLVCDDRGSAIEAATEEGLSQRLAFERDFPNAVDRAATARTRRPADVVRPQTAKLRLTVEPLRGNAAAQVIGGPPEIVGVTPVHVRIDNQTEKRYRLRTQRLKLLTQEGQSNRPLGIDEVAARLAPEWQVVAREQQLADVDVDPGATVDGYVFVPAAAYRRAKVILIEAESEEAEGFSVEF